MRTPQHNASTHVDTKRVNAIHERQTIRRPNKGETPRHATQTRLGRTSKPHLNIGATTTTPVRLNYRDGRDLPEGKDVPADLITVNAADVSATKIHFDEN